MVYTELRVHSSTSEGCFTSHGDTNKYASKVYFGQDLVCNNLFGAAQISIISGATQAIKLEFLLHE